MIVSLRRLRGLLLILTLSATCIAQSAPTDSASIHDKVESRGLGKSIKVKETNGNTVTGTIIAIEDDSFQVKPKHGARTVRIRNDEVAKAENGGLRTGVKVTIYVFIGLVLLGAIAGTRV